MNGFCVHQWGGFGLLRLNEARRARQPETGEAAHDAMAPWACHRESRAAVKSSQRSPVEAVLDCPIAGSAGRSPA